MKNEGNQKSNLSRGGPEKNLKSTPTGPMTQRQRLARGEDVLKNPNGEGMPKGKSTRDPW